MEIRRLLSVNAASDGPTLIIEERGFDLFVVALIEGGDRLLYASYSSFDVAEVRGIQMAHARGHQLLYIVHVEAVHAFGALIEDGETSRLTPVRA